MKLPLAFPCRGLLFAALALLTFSAAAAAAAFEGRVHMDITSGRKKEKMAMEYVMKNGKTRMEPQSNAQRDEAGIAGIIADPQAREMIILMEMEGQKMFMRRPMPPPAADPAAGLKAGRAVSAPVATGRTQVIAGYMATEYRAAAENGEVVELWLASDLGPFLSFSDGNPMEGRSPPSPGWEKFVREGSYFPMRVVARDTGGAETMRMEVTKVDKSPVSDALFSTAGYAELSLPGMMGGGGFNPLKP